MLLLAENNGIWAGMETLPTPDATPEPAHTPPARTPRNRPDVARPAKPFPEFPLHWAKRGYWRIKRDGQHVNYTADAIQSYKLFLEDERLRTAGQAPPRTSIRTKSTLEDARNLFLSHQQKRMTDGKIGAVQMGKYRQELAVELPRAIDMSTRLSGFADEVLAPELFEVIHTKAMKRGLSAAERHICYVRAMLTRAAKKKLMLPPVYGEENEYFAKPTPEQIAKAQRAKAALGGAQGSQSVWSMAEARRILAAAKAWDVHVYAQLVCAALAAYTSADLAALPLSAIDRARGVIDFPRVKNGKRRLCPLVPVLLQAIDASLAARPTPAAPEFAGLVFLTRNGTPINQTKSKLDEHGRVIGTGRKDALNLNLRRLCERLDALDDKAWAKRRKKRPADAARLRRPGLGQKTFRAMNYHAGLGAGVDKDFLAVLRGRSFQFPIEEYYLRGELQTDLKKLVTHIAKTFDLKSDPKTARNGPGRQNKPAVTITRPVRSPRLSDALSAAGAAPEDPRRRVKRPAVSRAAR